MGILNQQLIGGGNLENARRAPFSDAIGPDDTEKPGFGGYTYAADPELQQVFGTTAVTDRTGPQDGIALGESTQYGPVGFSRLSGDATTLLGEMSEMLKPREGDASAVATWTTAGGGSKIAHTIMSNSAMRSLKDKTTSGAVPNASGGAFAGYDKNNTYGVSNWLLGGGAGNIAVDAVAATSSRRATAEEMDAQASQDGTFRNVSVDRGLGIVHIGRVEGVEASNMELFRATTDITTGLRQLPPNPVEG